MLTPEITKLVDTAKEVRKKAYSPYYKVYVGAALLSEDGTIYEGCNIENVAGSAIICAESNALGSAVAKGARKFRAVAVVGMEDKILHPCGLCLQRLSEFAPQLDVYLSTTNGTVEHFRLDQLLTHPPKF